MLEKITPVLLTYNEAPNIGRTLERLRWAQDIVVVDSFSADATLDIARKLPQLRVFQRAFDSHANQWNFAVFETGVASEWVLALDADYILTQEATEEFMRLDAAAPYDAYRATFTYCLFGKPLRGGLYPPVPVLFRKANGRFFQDGHTHRLRVEGAIAPLESVLLHDDRKPLSHWLASQDHYMRLEADKISSTSLSELDWADRLRRFPPAAAIAIFLYCYILRGGVLDGKAGLYYALQRALAETLLGLRLIERQK